MNSIAIHRVDGKNLSGIIPAIVNVFRDDEVVPWHRYDECAAWVKRRAERGFYIAAAYDGDKMAGYSEWIETYDGGKKILYLGLMHVDCDLRGRGIGGAMLADGEKYAKSIGASILRTIPEDERSHNFYRKNGYVDTDLIYECICPASASSALPQDGEPAALTLDIVNTHEFIFGLCQSSGRHMYECANYNPEIGEYTAKTAHLPGGYLQFRHREGSKNALVLYWSNEEVTAERISAIIARGYEAGFEEVEFVFRSKYKHLFVCNNVTHAETEIERMIRL